MRASALRRTTSWTPGLVAAFCRGPAAPARACRRRHSAGGPEDVAALTQTGDLFQLSDKSLELQVPELESLLPLCCMHPCSPVQDPRLYGADGSWPLAYPALRTEALPPPPVVPAAPVTPRRDEVMILPLPAPTAR